MTECNKIISYLNQSSNLITIEEYDYLELFLMNETDESCIFLNFTDIKIYF